MKKILVVLVALVLLMSFATACEPKTAAETTEPTADKATETKATDATTTEEEPVDEEPVTITFYQPGPLEWIPDNPVSLYLDELANVKVERIIATSDHNEKIATSIATGEELADVFQYWGEKSAIVNGARSGYIIPLTDFISEAKTPNLMKYVPAGAWPTTKVLASEGDTNIYFIPRPIFNRADGVIVREDWLNAVGIEQRDDFSMTYDEFFDMLYAFTNDDPDGNGENDTYGITAGSNFMEEGLSQFKPYFGMLGWQASTTGEYEYMNPEYDLNDDVMIDFLGACATLWADGLIDPNTPNNVGDPNLSEVRMIQGIAGARGTGSNNIPSMQEQLTVDNPDGKLSYITRIVETPGEFGLAAGIGTGTWSEVFLSSSAIGKEEAIMRYLDVCLGDDGWNAIQYGFEDEHYDVVDGEKVRNQEKFEALGPLYVIVVLDRGVYNPGSYLGPEDADKETKARYATWAEGITSGLVASMDAGFSTNASKEQNYLDYQEMRKQVIAKIITGEMEPADYYTFLAEWYEKGGFADHAKEINEYIKSLG